MANRGGYTADGVTAGKDGAGYSEDFAYRDTTTASEGDVLDYILVSKLPHISSKATFLSEYTFTDTLSKGISYNRDLKIAFYNNAEDANANNTKNAVLLWNLSSGDYSQEYVDVTVQDPNTGAVTTDGSTRLELLVFTEAGFKMCSIGTGTNNPDGAENLDGLSDYYMVAYIRQRSIRMILLFWVMKEIQTMSIWSGAEHRTAIITCWKTKTMCTPMD